MGDILQKYGFTVVVDKNKSMIRDQDPTLNTMIRLVKVKNVAPILETNDSHNPKLPEPTLLFSKNRNKVSPKNKPTIEDNHSKVYPRSRRCA